MSQTIAPSETITKQVGNGGTYGPISLGYYPTEGSKVANTQYNWTSNLHYFEDLQFLKAYGIETSIQAIWIDNSANSYAVTIVIAGSNQQIIVPANFQGIFPAFFTDNAAFFISSAGTSTNGLTKICLLNVPVNTAGVWNAAGASSLQVTNGSGVTIPALVGTQSWNYDNITSAGGTVIIPAVAGKRWFLTNVFITLDYNSTLAVAGSDSIYLQDVVSGMGYFTNQIYIPNVAGTTEFPPNLVNMSGLNIIAPEVNSALELYIYNSSMTAGGVNVTLCGGYTTSTP